MNIDTEYGSCTVTQPLGPLARGARYRAVLVYAVTPASRMYGRVRTFATISRFSSGDPREDADVMVYLFTDNNTPLEIMLLPAPIDDATRHAMEDERVAFYTAMTA